jgi:hypothetical protein
MPTREAAVVLLRKQAYFLLELCKMPLFEAAQDELKDRSRELFDAAEALAADRWVRAPELGVAVLAKVVETKQTA